MIPRWPFASFLLGIAAAVVVESGTGLLVYLSPGLLPALTVVLGVALASLALGFATPVPASGGRWRWLGAAGSLGVAAALSAGWTFGPGDASIPVAPGVHLAFLVAAPLYGVGACLASLAREVAVQAFATVVLAGGAVGVLLLGVLLVPRLEPMSVYLVALLCVASAALVKPGS